MRPELAAIIGAIVASSATWGGLFAARRKTRADTTATLINASELVISQLLDQNSRLSAENARLTEEVTTLRYRINPFGTPGG